LKNASKYIDTSQPDASAHLEKAWADWNVGKPFPSTSGLRFGQYFIKVYTKEYNNPSVFYETNAEKAYTELLWAICSGELDNKIVTDYTTETNQKGDA
jgi:hypothetical protein